MHLVLKTDFFYIGFEKTSEVVYAIQQGRIFTGMDTEVELAR